MRVSVMLIIAMLMLGCKNEKDGAAMPSAPGKITVLDGQKVADDNVSPFVIYNVKGEHQVQFAPDGEENDTTRMIGAAVVSKSAPYSDIARRLAEKSLGKEYIVKCSPCHDNYANGVIGPSLLDKTADDIYGMIVKYRKDEKTNHLMQVFVNKMTDKEIRDISERIADFNQMMKESRSE